MSIAIAELLQVESVLARFWAKVHKTDDCWVWTASMHPNGYGQFQLGGRARMAHRISYVIHFGPIPDKHVIDHMCHNKPCVNPAHIQAVTNKQNGENRRGLPINNKSGVRGVHWCTTSRRWKATVYHYRRPVYAGSYQSLDDAEAAVIAKRNELFTNNLADRNKP